MKVSFMFKGQPVEAEVSCELAGSKHVVKGTVKRTDVEGLKSVFFLWDCTPKSDGTKKYEKPMLRQGKDSLPGVIRDQETEFVMAALYAYKEHKTPHPYDGIISTTPEGFEEGRREECSLPSS